MSSGPFWRSSHILEPSLWSSASVANNKVSFRCTLLLAHESGAVWLLSLKWRHLPTSSICAQIKWLNMDSKGHDWICRCIFLVFPSPVYLSPLNRLVGIAILYVSRPDGSHTKDQTDFQTCLFFLEGSTRTQLTRTAAARRFSFSSLAWLLITSRYIFKWICQGQESGARVPARLDDIDLWA